MDPEVLEKAKKLIPNPDIIANMNNMTILWMSQSALNNLGISESDVIGKVGHFLSDLPLNESKKIAQKQVRIHNGVMQYPVKAPNGTLLITVKYNVFEHNLIFYYVGEGISIKPIQKNNI